MSGHHESESGAHAIVESRRATRRVLRHTYTVVYTIQGEVDILRFQGGHGWLAPCHVSRMDHAVQFRDSDVTFAALHPAGVVQTFRRGIKRVLQRGSRIFAQVSE